jgi:hypothetical protein
MKMLCRRVRDVFERYCLVNMGGCGSLTMAVVWASIESLSYMGDGENLTMLKDVEFLYLWVYAMWEHVASSNSV